MIQNLRAATSSRQRRLRESVLSAVVVASFPFDETNCALASNSPRASPQSPSPAEAARDVSCGSWTVPSTDPR